MLRPKLLPDELVGSYKGAIARFNGIVAQSPKRLEQELRLFVDQRRRCDEGKTSSPMTRLAAIAGVEPESLQKHHTLGPLKSAIFSASRGDPSEGWLRESWGDEWTKSVLDFCPDCVVADVDAYGRSYWRREHQLPGLYWCPKHRRGLRRVTEKLAYLRPPSAFLETSEEFDFDWVRTLWSDPYVNRYLDVLNAVMEASWPVPVTVFRDALREGAKPFKYQVHPNGGAAVTSTPGILSHHVHARFPTEWLRATFAGYQPPSPFKLQFWLDGTLWMTTPSSSAPGYALAATMLFPSGHEFMYAVRRHCKDAGPTRAPKRTSQVPQTRSESGCRVAATLSSASARKAELVKLRRKKWPLERKAAIVRRTYLPGATVANVAVQEGLLPQTINKWRRLAKVGQLVTLAPGDSVHSSELALARAEIARLERVNNQLVDENQALRNALELFVAQA